MRHFLNDVEISPRNIEEIGVISDFTDRPDTLELNTDSVILPREGRDIILQHIYTQGVFEGIPYRIEMEPGIVLQYYVDLTEDTTYRSHEIEVKIKRRNALDNFFDKANGTSFELMAKQGVIFPTIDVPYQIQVENQAEQALILGISLYAMIQGTQQAIADAAEAVADLINALTPNVGTGVTYDVGDIIAVGLKAVIKIAYAVAMLAATINLAQQLIDVIFPPVRYYKACTVRALMEWGCEYLGFNFSSTILNNPFSGYTILPVPLIKAKKSIFDNQYTDLQFSFTKGYPTAQDSTPTLGQLFTEMEKMFNARTKVVNGTVYFERRDYWQNLANNTIIPALKLQDKRQDEYTLNTLDVWKRYYISYTPDYSDTCCIDFFDPTDAEYSTEPANVINADLVSIKGLNEVRLPFALGVRKTKLTLGEKYLKFLLASIDELTGLFGGGTSFASQISGRIGILTISSQFYSVSKMLYLQYAKQPLNYQDFVSARALWNKYHYINQIQLNDYKIRTDVRTRISKQDFLNLLDNNFIDLNGLIVEVLRVEYVDISNYAIISYREPFDYANGKVTTLTINE